MSKYVSSTNEWIIIIISKNIYRWPILNAHCAIKREKEKTGPKKPIKPPL